MAEPMRPLLCLFFLLTCSACASTYSPVTPVAPLLDRAGDVVLGGSVRATFPHHGATAFLAAAPTESTRVYVAGSFTRMVGSEKFRDWPSKGDERNHTNQVEAGAGWGTTHKKFGSHKSMIAEVLVGGGYGYTKAAQCAWVNNDNQHCLLWMDSSSHFAKGFVQGQVARKWRENVVGAGLKVSVLHHDVERLFGASADTDAWFSTVEPFVVSRFGYRWGKLEVGMHFPFVPWSSRVKRYSSEDFESDGSPEVSRVRFADSLAPRINIGVQTNLAELWR